jgi:hypothetical protein
MSERLASGQESPRQPGGGLFLGECGESWNESAAACMSPMKSVEAEILKLIGRTPFDGLLDLGTGTGRMLELLSDRYRRAIGVDSSRRHAGHRPCPA